MYGNGYSTAIVLDHRSTANYEGKQIYQVVITFLVLCSTIIHVHVLIFLQCNQLNFVILAVYQN